MKLISLNIWGGHVYEPLLEFINHYQEVDVFCLQEVYSNASDKITTEERWVALHILEEISLRLPTHQILFKPIVNGIYGIAMLIHKHHKIIAHGAVCIFDNPNYSGRGPTHSRFMQWAHINNNNHDYIILNIHGLWNGQGKLDSTDRLIQAEIVANFIKKQNQPTILCGDFNLRPDTNSIKIISEGMCDLIKHYNIQSTRTSFYPKEEKFADYIFTSKEVKVLDFSVLQNEVSDHAPLLLDFI